MEQLDQLFIDQPVLAYFRDVLIVLGIGFLLGLERQFSKSMEPGHEKLFAGVRTFPMVALLGYLSLFLATQYSIWIYLGCLAAVVILVAISYFFSNRAGHAGSTSEFAILIGFILGSVVFSGKYQIAIGTTVIVTTILALKINIHKAIAKLERPDLFAILFFIVITALALPQLPNRDIGPYGVFNLYNIWLIVVLFVSLNFLAYFLNKYLEQRKSVLITGILGGFASSTATAWYFARQSGKSKEGGVVEAAAIILASSIMFPRIIVWLLILNQSLFRYLALPLLLFGLSGLITGYLISKKNTPGNELARHEFNNPINLREALLFAAIYVGIRWLVGYAGDQFGEQGVYVASGIAGITDIDAIAIAMADYGMESALLSIAAVCILIAAFTNTFIKYLFCLIFGNSHLKRYTSYVLLPIFFTGIVYILVLAFLR